MKESFEPLRRADHIERREGESTIDYLRRLEKSEQYLFHGSSDRIEELEPRDPITDATDEQENKRTAVYAYSSPELAIQRAILPKRSDIEGDWDVVGGTNPLQPEQPLLQTTPNLLLGSGWVHVLLRKNFEHTHGYQWVSEMPVRPRAFVGVTPETYRDMGGVHEVIEE